MSIKQSYGSVIRKNLLSVYPGAVMYGLLFNISLMIDSIIAGQKMQLPNRLPNEDLGMAIIHRVLRTGQESSPQIL